MTNNISFKANFIQSSVIKRSYQNKAPKNLAASFVELATDNFLDKEALSRTNHLWKEYETFAGAILDQFEDDCIMLETNKKYYALTLQKRNLDRLDANKILGLAEVISGFGRIKLKFLQADPKNNMHSSISKYKGIGTAILNTLKELYPDKDIILTTVESARDFYKANGFEDIPKTLSDMIFKHSTATNLPK